MIYKFKKGDRVRCIEGHDRNKQKCVIEGHEYIITKVNKESSIRFIDGEEEYFINVCHEKCGDESSGWLSTRFKLVSQLLPDELFEL